MRNKKNSIFGIVVILVLVFLSLFYWIATTEQRYITAHCPEYVPNKPGFVDNARIVECKGNIAIEQWQGERRFEVIYYTFKSGDYASYDLAYVDKYLFSDSALFFIENPETNIFSYGERCDDPMCSSKTKYFEFYQNSVKESRDYSDVGEVPLYRKIDLVTGDFTLYKDLKDVPQSEKKFYEELLSSQTYTY